MKIARKWILTGLILAIILGTASFASFEGNRDVRLYLPKFKVTINGQEIDNEFRDFPFIVYNDITYFPMTYHDSRFMGIETAWSNETGLTIKKIGGQGEYKFTERKVANASKYFGDIASFAVVVNGKKIDNASEKYPLLLFRDVTYFPLTWRFAVDEFGWEYSFIKEEGLVIRSK